MRHGRVSRVQHRSTRFHFTVVDASRGIRGESLWRGKSGIKVDVKVGLRHLSSRLSIYYGCAICSLSEFFPQTFRKSWWAFNLYLTLCEEHLQTLACQGKKSVLNSCNLLELTCCYQTRPLFILQQSKIVSQVVWTSFCKVMKTCIKVF